MAREKSLIYKDFSFSFRFCHKICHNTINTIRIHRKERRNGARPFLFDVI